MNKFGLDQLMFAEESTETKKKKELSPEEKQLKERVGQLVDDQVGSATDKIVNSGAKAAAHFMTKRKSGPFGKLRTNLAKKKKAKKYAGAVSPTAQVVAKSTVRNYLDE